MPLKHSQETAYLAFLALMICLFGFAISLLPHVPQGLSYGMTLFAISVVYPIFLLRTFKANRADYEFRLLHWFPAGMCALWILLQYTAPLAHWIYVLQLGFFFLWSLPLVALGLSFIGLFAVHVIRRSKGRVLLMSIFCILFTVGALAAESKGWNRGLQAMLYPKDRKALLASLESRAKSFSRLIYQPQDSGAVIVMNTSSVSSSKSKVSHTVFSSSVSKSEVILADVPRPKKLPKSGPESAGVLAAFLLAGYCSVIQRRQEG